MLKMKSRNVLDCAQQCVTGSSGIRFYDPCLCYMVTKLSLYESLYSFEWHVSFSKTVSKQKHKNEASVSIQTSKARQVF